MISSNLSQIFLFNGRNAARYSYWTLPSSHEQSFRMFCSYSTPFAYFLTIVLYFLLQSVVPVSLVVYHLHQKPIWFQTVQMERKYIVKGNNGKKRKYIVKGLELDGKPSKMLTERNKPVEKSQPVKEDNLFKHTGFSGNFPIGSTKNMCSIYFLSGITGIFMSMVNNPCNRELPLLYHLYIIIFIF